MPARIKSLRAQDTEKYNLLGHYEGCVLSMLHDFSTLRDNKGFPGGWAVKNLPAMQETQERWVWSLEQKTPLEEGMATHSSILARKIPRREGPGKLRSMGLQRVGHDWSDWACMHEETINWGSKSISTLLWLFYMGQDIVEEDHNLNDKNILSFYDCYKNLL